MVRRPAIRRVTLTPNPSTRAGGFDPEGSNRRRAPRGPDREREEERGREREREEKREGERGREREREGERRREKQKDRF